MAISKDISEEDVETPLVSESPKITDITPPSDPPKVEPMTTTSKSHMFAIDMGGCDIVLGADWLRTLGPILMDFKALTM